MSKTTEQIAKHIAKGATVKFFDEHGCMCSVKRTGIIMRNDFQKVALLYGKKFAEDNGSKCVEKDGRLVSHIIFDWLRNKPFCYHSELVQGLIEQLEILNEQPKAAFEDEECGMNGFGETEYVKTSFGFVG